MGTFLKEGMSSNRPPLFDGSNYNYWCSRMRCHVQAIDFTLWRIITDGPLVPKMTKVTAPTPDNATGSAELVAVDDINTVELSKLGKDELEKISLNAKAVNILHQSLCAEEYGRIQGCETAKAIWDCLASTHVGTSQVKDTKIRVLTAEYEGFKMKDDETISSMHQRLNLIINNLKALGKLYSMKDVNGKILSCLTKEYRPKTCAITESKDIGTLSTEDLVGSLLAFEVELNSYKAQDVASSRERRSLALQATQSYQEDYNDDSDTEDPTDEEMALYARKFKKFFGKPKNFNKEYPKRTNFKKGNQERSEPLRCFECNQPGHIRTECPKLKSRQPQRRAMKATWDSYASEDEVEEQGEKANVVCCMANETIEVSPRPLTIIESDYYSDNDIENMDLEEAYDELCNDHKILLKKVTSSMKSNSTKSLKIESLEKELAELKVELSKTKEEKLEVLKLKEDFEKLKVENDVLKVDLKKLDTGEKTLTKIIDSQHEYVERRGLGYEGPSTSSAYKGKTVFVASTSTNTEVLSKKPKVIYTDKTQKPHKAKSFSCTYCQKGNHGTFHCPIRKLCEMGTLIPEWMKPKWVVKKNPLATNHQGPKKPWVPPT